MHPSVSREKPNIFEYDDCRAFLKDLYAFYKQTTSHFSYRYFAKRAGFTSPNFLKLVIEGQRNLSEESASRFAQALRLSKPEAGFFTKLVQFSQSRSPEERVRSAREIVKSRAFKRIHPLRQAELNYYAKWYYIPIRELVSTQAFREDAAWIARQFRMPLTAEEAAAALVDLQKLGLIARDDEGKLKPTHCNVASGDDVVSSLIAEYHREMINRARESIDLVPAREREISGTCISCSATTVIKIKAMVREFRKEIMALAEEAGDADLVYQMNFQLFPLAGRDPEEET